MICSRLEKEKKNGKLKGERSIKRITDLSKQKSIPDTKRGRESGV